MNSQSKIVLLAATSCFSLSAFAQEAAPAPVPAAAPVAVEASALQAVVQEVSGVVQVRLAADQPWQKAVVGMTLPEGAEIRTGPKSVIRCSIGQEQLFTLDRLGVVKLAEAVRTGNSVRTDLSMKYGRTQYAIEAGGLEHESTITSPGSTLAVRGTIVELYDQPPYKARATSFTGRANFISGRLNTTVGAAGGGKASLTTDNNTTAQAALTASVLDPRVAAARTPSEKTAIAREVSRGGITGFDEVAQIRTVRGGSGPIRTESELVPTLPGRLNFVARWTGNADINLEVFLDKGDPNESFVNSGGLFVADEFIFPGFGLDRSASGGITAFDHRGGPNGGTEIVYWPNSAPVGTFGLGVIHVSGEPTEVVVNAFLDGQKINFFDFIIDPENPKTATLRATIGPGEFLAPAAFNPPLQILEDIFPEATGGAPADISPSSPPPSEPPAQAQVITTASVGGSTMAGTNAGGQVPTVKMTAKERRAERAAAAASRRQAAAERNAGGKQPKQPKDQRAEKTSTFGGVRARK